MVFFKDYGVIGERHLDLFRCLRCESVCKLEYIRIFQCDIEEHFCIL